jgi:hypothetical protein
MPVCRECGGTGQREIKKEITQRCPDCHGTKRLKGGLECERCNDWGEIATGEFETEKQLCNECWGSGRVSEGSVTVWFLLRVVPATIVFLGGGGLAIWLSWRTLSNPLLTSIASVLFFGGWGGAMVYFIKQMPRLGEISVTNWFLIRAIPTTLVALGAGGPVVWSSWVYGQNAPVTAILAIAAFAIWGALMYYFISHLPE